MKAKVSLADRIVPIADGKNDRYGLGFNHCRELVAARVAELERGATRGTCVKQVDVGWTFYENYQCKAPGYTHTHTALLIDVQEIGESNHKSENVSTSAQADSMAKLHKAMDECEEPHRPDAVLKENKPDLCQERNADVDARKQAAERLRELADTEVVNTEPMFDALNEIADSLDPKPITKEPEMKQLDLKMQAARIRVTLERLRNEGISIGELHEGNLEYIADCLDPKPKAEPVPVNELLTILDFGTPVGRENIRDRIEAARKAGHPTGVK